MIRKQEIIPFLNKEIGILYNDSGREIFTRGLLLTVTDDSVTIKTKYNIHIISLQNINKIKIPLV